MLQESERMAVDTANRLGTAVGDLRDLVVRSRHRRSNKAIPLLTSHFILPGCR